MTRLNAGTKRWNWALKLYRESYVANDVRYAYATRCSAEKISEFDKIKSRAIATTGYNHDLKVVSANSYTYTTCYSFNDEYGILHIVIDTKASTYEACVG